MNAGFGSWLPGMSLGDGALGGMLEADNKRGTGVTR
jgi:hypothetical protein